jgi:undecaprenyl diphosphate synthase
MAVRRIVEAAARQGVSVLSLYAFSADNWGRPAKRRYAFALEKYLR